MNETCCGSDPISHTNAPHVYEIRSHGDGRVDLISDVLPFRCACWYSEPDAISRAMAYAELYSRSHDAVIWVYDEAGDAIWAHEHKGDFKEQYRTCGRPLY
jgi:hypothetical protein